MEPLLAPGWRVRVQPVARSLHGADSLWGTVLAVDSVGVRLMLHPGPSKQAELDKPQVVIPWGNIAQVEVLDD